MDQIFYIAARSQEKNGGIYGYGQDDGHSCEQVFFTPLKGVSYLAYSPKRRYLYAVYKEGTVNKVASYDLSDDSTLVFMNSVETHGESSCHITTDPACRYLYCANYTSGNLNEFKLENGSFTGEGRMITYSGKLGPNRRRQEHTHAHCVRFTPDYNYLCLVDLGLDEVLLFRFTPEKGIENTPAFRYRGIAGSGPRHILFSPDGRHAWLANEVDNTVSVLEYADGTLKHVSTLSTLPEGLKFEGETKVAALRLSPNGKHLLVSNRGYDSIACYHVAPDASLTLYDIVNSYGAGPRDINFLPCGCMVAACNELSGNVTFFRYDPDSGKLTYLLGEDVKVPGPLCVI